MATSVKMMPVPEGVALPSVFSQIKDGVFTPNDLNIQGAASILNEMIKWAEALKPLREGIKGM